MDDLSEHFRQDSNAGSLSHLQSLFQHNVPTTGKIGDDTPPATCADLPPDAKGEEAAFGEEEERLLQRKSTRKGSNTTKSKFYNQNAVGSSIDERTSLLVSSSDVAGRSRPSAATNDLFQSPGYRKTPKTGPIGRKSAVSLPVCVHNSRDNRNKKIINSSPLRERAVHSLKEAGKEMVTPTTWIGALVFVTYHVVFCLAAGSAIQRPHARNSILGLMTKMAALGIIFSGPVYLINIGNDIPSMYPTCDLFLAPILASIAKVIDEDLANDSTISDEENDSVFLATFAFLTALGMGLAGLLLILAGVFKLANLGSFLPFPVGLFAILVHSEGNVLLIQSVLLSFSGLVWFLCRSRNPDMASWFCC